MPWKKNWYGGGYTFTDQLKPFMQELDTRYSEKYANTKVSTTMFYVANAYICLDIVRDPPNWFTSMPIYLRGVDAMKSMYRDLSAYEMLLRGDTPHLAAFDIFDRILKDTNYRDLLSELDHRAESMSYVLDPLR